MDIETELPEDFDELSDEEKVIELEKLKGKLDEGSDSNLIKKRMVEELIREYSS
jgi:hypothetical protein